MLAPDVNQSEVRWIGKNKRMRVGLVSIKGLSGATQDRIVIHRRSGPYKSLTDFLSRVAPHEDEVRQLVHCGALDAFGPEGCRAWLMWAMARWQAGRNAKLASRPLFENALEEVPLPVLPPDDTMGRLRQEFSVLGFLCDRHPMTLYEDTLKEKKIIKAACLRRHVGRQITLAGWLITGKKGAHPAGGDHGIFNL